MRIRTDGKQFAAGDERFTFRGVTYGTFRPRDDDGSSFPSRSQIKSDFASMAEAGFTVVRTYTPPPDDLVEVAADWQLRLMVDAFYPDWRYLVGASSRQRRSMAREARHQVRAVARRFVAEDTCLAVSLGNEVPADVVRWVGIGTVKGLLEELGEIVREEDPALLVTYANYPTAEYLPLPFLDFLTFNVFLEDRSAFRQYLGKLHQLAGDRPLVLGEMGMDSRNTVEGEQRQAEALDWQLCTLIDRGVAGSCVFSWTDEWWVGPAAVEGWHFGLTRADRSPRPALEVAKRWNARSVADVPFDWPSISIVICAYNAAETLDECLRHVDALAYPDLEVIVVDDGSTDATAEIARRHSRVRLVEIQHAGLSAARNEGFHAARGELVAYLDSDAYPTHEWPFYLALAFDSPTVGGAGGPNIPPRDDPPAAQRIARAPGGPVHVLTTDDRAEHVPGCNMAFWKKVLSEVGGFDPVYTAAGDDVDVCWKVLDRGWEIAFHPAALVWHHRRASGRAYLRQQRGYGRAEALVQVRHPHRFTPTGSARWRGRIYNSFTPNAGRQRIYRGIYGAAAYQSVYGGGGYSLDLLHQVGVPAAVSSVPVSALLALQWPVSGVFSLAGLILLCTLFVIDAVRAPAPSGMSNPLGFRLGVAALHLAQPLARSWGRARQRPLARNGLPTQRPLPGPVTTVGRNMLLLPHDRPRDDLAATVVGELRRSGLRVVPPNGWEDYDARFMASALMRGDLVSSAFPVGCVQIRVRRQIRWLMAVGYVAILMLAAMAQPYLGLALLVAGVVDLVKGLWRTGPLVRRIVRSATA